MKTRFFTTILLAAALAALPFCSAVADSIQLVNGDHLNGKVISLNDKEVKLKSDVLGEISIQREKVLGITFGDQKSPPVRTAAPASTSGTPSVADSILKEFKANGVDPSQLNDLLEKAGVEQPGGISGARSDKARGDSPDDVLDQLRSGGVDKEMVKELKVKLPLLNLPGVGTYFDQTLSGLSSGNLDLQHLRKDAVTARDGLLDLKQDLGPSGAALDGYLRILNKFIDETAPPADEPADKPKEDSDATQDKGKT